jgi:hypothetical protein
MQCCLLFISNGCCLEACSCVRGTILFRLPLQLPDGGDDLTKIGGGCNLIHCSSRKSGQMVHVQLRRCWVFASTPMAASTQPHAKYVYETMGYVL